MLPLRGLAAFAQELRAAERLAGRRHRVRDRARSGDRLNTATCSPARGSSPATMTPECDPAGQLDQVRGCPCPVAGRSLRHPACACQQRRLSMHGQPLTDDSEPHASPKRKREESASRIPQRRINQETVPRSASSTRCMSAGMGAVNSIRSRVTRVIDGEAGGVQCLPLDEQPCRLRRREVRRKAGSMQGASAVEPVAEHRAADRRQVHADLVRPPGLAASTLHEGAAPRNRSSTSNRVTASRLVEWSRRTAIFSRW